MEETRYTRASTTHGNSGEHNVDIWSEVNWKSGAYITSCVALLGGGAEVRGGLVFVLPKVTRETVNSAKKHATCLGLRLKAVASEIQLLGADINLGRASLECKLRAETASRRTCGCEAE